MTGQVRPTNARVLAAIVGVALVGLVIMAGAPAQARDKPSVTVVEDGKVVSIHLDGWPAGETVSVSACGRKGANGSADCAVSAGTVVVVDGDGSGRGTIRSAGPPVPCPCVIRAASVSAALVASAPAPLSIVKQAATSAPKVIADAAEPDSATVYRSTVPPLAQEPVITPAIYVAAVASAGAATLVVLLIRRRKRPQRNAGRGFRVVAWIAGTTAIALVVGVGYRSVADAATTARAQQGLGNAAFAAAAGAQAPKARTAGAIRQTSVDAAAAAASDGEAAGVMRVPRWGASGTWTFVEGVTKADLAKGPGHYPGTARPGEIGNFALAGHRGSAGQPFNDIDKLVSGDRIMIDAGGKPFVYEVTGHAIVTPDRVDVVAPVPERPDQQAEAAVLTLTACHPRYSDKLRWVVWAKLIENAP